MEVELIMIIIGAYLAVLLIIGALASRGIVSLSDYYLGGRAITWPLVLSLTATYFSGYGYMGVAGMFYMFGFAFLAVAVAYAPITAFLYWKIGYSLNALARKYNFLTLPELLGDFYRSSMVRYLGVIVAILFTLPYIQLQMISSGILFSTVTKGAVTYEVGALILAIILIIYTVMGGYRAAAWTDAFQGILLLSGLLFGGILVSMVLGGYEELVKAALDKLGPAFFTLPGLVPAWKMIFAATLVITIILGLGPTNPAYAMISMAAKNPKIIKAGAFFYSFIPWLCVFFGSLWIGIGGRVLFPDLPKPDAVFPQLLTQYTPIPVMALFMAAGLAAMMSTADTYAVNCSSVVVQEYRQVRRKMSERSLVILSRILVVIISLVALMLGILYPGLLFFVMVFAMSWAVQLVPVTVGALFWPRGTKAGAIAGIIAGLIAVVLTAGLPGMPTAWKNFAGIHTGVWGLMLNSLFFVVVSYLTKPVPADRVEKFHGYLKQIWARK